MLWFIYRISWYIIDEQSELDMHIGFVDGKRLAMIFLIDNDGGELELFPNPTGYDYNEVTLPLSKNKLIVFRCDALGLNYSYRPKGKHMALQSWVLDVPSAWKDKEEALRILDGPEEPEGRRNNVMGVCTRYPGLGFEVQAYWNMLAAGTDTEVKIPIQRWDTDIYYRAEHTIGFSMTCHGANLQQSEIEMFDNQFFGIDKREAIEMAPYMRVMLEVGYEALHNAGHRRSELKNWKCGVFCGDSGSDWDGIHYTMGKDLDIKLAGRERSAAANRLSHVFGLTGPTSTAETACSSSLVATGIAQMTMRSKLEDQQTPNITTELKHGLVIGSNLLLGPGGYISLSGPGMLTHQGRCFTFDNSADGFARGEGVGSVKLKVCEDSVEASGRVAMLIGCSVNQDGRSASMTAPHGPSQQEVIRQSMREAGLSPNSITIAECHGTGTALGDPIEIGALRGVMRADRARPILKTSSKTNLGHLEAGAGMAGLIKCICMLNYSSGAPNIHLLTLNPHLDVAGYPVYFESELLDYGYNSGLTGVSSFGFGGTNARADVWGHATKGHRYCITGPLEFGQGALFALAVEDENEAHFSAAILSTSRAPCLPAFLRNGPSDPRMGGPIDCFNCGGDHFARDCPEGPKGKGKDGKGKSKGPVSCWNCGGDHVARDCPDSGKGKGKSKGKSVDCFNCGGDHFARDCPEGGKSGKGGKGKGKGGGVCYDFRRGSHALHSPVVLRASELCSAGTTEAASSGMSAASATKCEVNLSQALVASVVQQGQASVPSCAIVGQGYDDPVVTSVNGGTGVLDASVCQEKCAQHLNCSVFTYYLQGGGCWLQGSGLQPKAIPNAVAGPRSCDASSIPRPSPAASPKPASPKPAAAARAPVSADAMQVLTTTLMPARFIKAGDDLYFAEGSDPRRKHLVRFACFGCEDACSNFVSVSPDYADALSQDIDFTCSMLDTTTTTVGFVADGQKEELLRVPFWSPSMGVASCHRHLASLLLRFCVLLLRSGFAQEAVAPAAEDRKRPAPLRESSTGDRELHTGRPAAVARAFNGPRSPAERRHAGSGPRGAQGSSPVRRMRPSTSSISSLYAEGGRTLRRHAGSGYATEPMLAEHCVFNVLQSG
eukprot:s1303_g11.t3